VLFTLPPRGANQNNEWNHIVGTLKKGQWIRLYQDSHLMAESTTFNGDTGDTDSPLYLGRRSDGQFLKGRVMNWLSTTALWVTTKSRSSTTAALLENAGWLNPRADGGSATGERERYYFLSANLSALALGTPRPDYQWYRSNSPAAWDLIPNATNATLSYTTSVAVSEDSTGWGPAMLTVPPSANQHGSILSAIQSSVAASMREHGKWMEWMDD